jgi:hypothetical protein
MQRGHLVEAVRIHDLKTRLEQLGADDERHDAADNEHREAEPEVHRADVLVIRRCDPAHDAAGVIVCVVVRVVGTARNRSHEYLLNNLES